MRKMFLGFTLFFVCTLGFSFNVLAEETNNEEYYIEVTTKMGSVASTLDMSLEGFDKEKAVTNKYDYFVKFVKENDGKPVLSGNPQDSDEGVDYTVDSYNVVNVGLNPQTNEYYSIINMYDDWYILDGYTKAYIIKCIAYDECEVLEEPVTVERPALPSLSQRYENFLFTKDEQNSLSVFQYFPSIGKHGDHEVNVKIGLINDNELLTKIANNHSGAYEELMKYAKTNNGTIFTAKEDDFINGVDIGDFEVINGSYYYMYTYYTNTNGLYRNLDDIAVAMAKNDYLVNDVDWSRYLTEDELWNKFVEEFKKTDIVKSIEEDEEYEGCEVNITHTSDSLKVVLNDGTDTWTTDFKYENGILTYIPAKDKEVAVHDSIWISNSLKALINLKGYNAIKVANWIAQKKSYSFDKDGLSAETEEYSYNGERDGVSTTIKTNIYKEFKLDIKNGLNLTNEPSNGHYDIVEGKNQKYIVGTTKELKFKINAEFNLFDNVYVDGKEVNKDNYTVEEGSTIIILKKEYLDTLNNGIHTLKVTFKDGKSVQTQFTIERPIKNPNTGINMQYGILSILIIVGLSTYLLIRKKTKFPKHN